MTANLFTNLLNNNSKQIFKGKLHIFLTCLRVSRDLKKTCLDEQSAEFLEELSLKCICKTMQLGEIELWQIELLLLELPLICTLKYKIVDDLKK